MAIVKTPLLSESASGSIAKTITYKANKKKYICAGSYLKKVNGYYFKRVPVKSNTIQQNNIRGVFFQAKEEWNKLNEEEKKVYEDNSKGKKYTGYNLYIKEKIIEIYKKEIYSFLQLTLQIDKKYILLINKLDSREFLKKWILFN